MYSLYHIFIVIKAERIPYDSMDTMYTFPDDNDDLTNYTGGNAQVMLPNGLLQGNGMHNHTQMPSHHMLKYISIRKIQTSVISHVSLNYIKFCKYNV